MNSRRELSAGNVLVLVPAFNEEQSVERVLIDLKSHGYRVLLISDGSHDRTAELGRAAGVSVVELPINLGVGGALRAGFKYAIKHKFEAIIQVDADGQHPADEIVNLISEANRTKAHMVIGSRFITGESSMQVSGIRRIAMILLSRSATSAANTRITDSTSGFRLIRQPLLAEFAHQFANNYLGDTYESVISAGRGKYTIVEIPAALRKREIGESTASSGSAFRFTLKGLGVALLGLHKRLNRQI